ncbi:Cystinosin, partial [Fasciolopsis buskii]
ATLNFRSKSTVGWSIGNVLLDFVGGVLSIVQIFMVAYNESDWASISGALGKLGLGLCTIGFDLLFIVQHFCLYRPISTSHVSYLRLAWVGDKDKVAHTSLLSSEEPSSGEFPIESVP